jgi:hypothetical protein
MYPFYLEIVQCFQRGCGHSLDIKRFFQLEKPFIMTCHSDKSEQEQKEYYAKSLDQSWMFVPFGKPVREFLKLYKLHGLPSVKLIDNDGSLVEEEVKKQIEVGHQKGKAGDISSH